MSNIFVTGAAGFIGSHVVKKHLEQGDKVWGVDNLQAGQLQNIEPYQGMDGFKFEVGDVCNWPSLDKAVAWADRIYHMAAIVGQRQVLSSALLTLTDNIHSLEQVLLSMCRVNKRARLLVPSSSSVYCYTEAAEDGTFKETAMMSLPSGAYRQESYELSKIVNEVMTLSYVAEKGLDCVIIRIFNCVGYNQTSRYGMVVPTFVEQALRKEPLTIYGTGNQTRSFSDARDVVTACDLLLNKPESKGEIFNCGNDFECSILDLAHLVLKKTGSKSPVKFMTYQEAYGLEFVDVPKRRPNLTKLKKLTGYKPSYSLEQTVGSVIQKVSERQSQSV